MKLFQKATLSISRIFFPTDQRKQLGKIQPPRKKPV